MNQNLLGKETFGCFVDFRKAFDSVNHDLLWNKLNQYGINGNFLHSLYIQAMYSGFQYAVEVNNKCTPYFTLNCGVKQGCPLSPSLFSLFINDLLVDLNASGLGVDCGGYTNIPVLGYADDTALFAGNPI